MGDSKAIAVICASNQNRSMETHHLFQERGVPNVFSYGTGSQIKLPGPTRNQPNVYDFGVTTYQEIFNDLSAKDRDLYAIAHYQAFCEAMNLCDRLFIDSARILLTLSLVI